MTNTTFSDTPIDATVGASTVLRGRILRDPAAAPGLISCDGQQTPFTLEQHWRSDMPPTVGMSVDATFDAAGSLQTIRAIADSELAKEELRRLAGQSQQKAKAAASAAYEASAPAVRGLIAQIGTPSLVAMAGIALSFFYLKAATISFGDESVLSVSPTVYDLTRQIASYGYLVSALTSGNATLLSWTCIAAVFAPLLPYLLRRSRPAWLGYCAPLAFLILLPAIFVSGLPSGTLHRLFSGGQGYSSMPGAFVTSERDADLAAHTLQQLHVDPGAGLAIAMIAALFLAGKGLFRFLAFR